MRTHLGCTGSVELGPISKETQSRLEEIEATWLEYLPTPPSLVVRHVQPDAISAPREIAGELLEFLSHISDRERAGVSGGALYYLDEQSGQYFRLKVAAGGNLTVSWAHPDYAHAQAVPYEGQTVPVVFEPFQCLNGWVKFKADPEVAEKLRAVIERPGGLYPQGDFALDVAPGEVVLALREVNSSVVPLVDALRELARPGSLKGHIEVTSFRAGDLDDYCRLVFQGPDVWLLRPSLWNDTHTTQVVGPWLTEPVTN
ncbi:MAG TPA: hypothetical protein VG028_17950 [Terriglobia bacterium]|nr:hypothetical protein [Terriglobia bacterium]